MSERRLTPQRWSVTVQHRWQDSEPVVAIAVGGWESTGPALLECVLAETLDPVEAVEAALATAERLKLAIDLESAVTYGDWPDATAAGTGYSSPELNALAQHWLSRQPECDGCGDWADLVECEDWETGWDGAVCSEYCAELAVSRWMSELERGECAVSTETVVTLTVRATVDTEQLARHLTTEPERQRIIREGAAAEALVAHLRPMLEDPCWDSPAVLRVTAAVSERRGE